MDRSVFFDRVRSRPFGGRLGQSQVAGTSAILDCWDRTKFADPRWLAYALATTYHETWYTMQPIAEVGHGRGHPYGLPAGPWHNVYYGRGDVQETWETNYKKASAKLKAHGLDVNLDRYPDKAMEPDIAAAILLYGMAEGWFTGSALPHWFSATVNDPLQARRIVNGMNKAPVVASYHCAFLDAIKAAA